MLLALTMALSASAAPTRVDLLVGEPQSLELPGAVRVTLEGDASEVGELRDGRVMLTPVQLGRATLTVWKRAGKPRTVMVAVLPRPVASLGGGNTRLYRRCPGAPDEIVLGVGLQKLVTPPADTRSMLVQTPETIEARPIGERVLVMGLADGPGELRFLRDGQPPVALRFEVVQQDPSLRSCELCRAAPCGSRLRLYSTGRRLWLGGSYQGLEEWAAYRALVTRYPNVPMPPVPAELVSEVVSAANAALERARLTARVHLAGGAVAVVEPGGAPPTPEALGEIDRVLAPLRDRLQAGAEASVQGPADWSFKLSRSLRDQHQAWAQRRSETVDAGSPTLAAPPVDVVIHLAQGSTAALAGAGVSFTPVSRTVVTAQVPLDRLPLVAAVGPVFGVYAAGEVRLPPPPAPSPPRER